LFNCRTKLAKLLCLKCFGRMPLVNFSFCGRHVSILGADCIARKGPYFNHNETVSLVTPSNDRRVRRVYQHPEPAISLVSSRVCGGCVRAGRGATYLYNLRTWETMSKFSRRGCPQVSDLQSHWSCWPKPCRPVHPFCNKMTARSLLRTNGVAELRYLYRIQRDSEVKDQALELMKSPGEPICQMAVIGGWSVHNGIDCPANRSNKTLFRVVRLSATDAVNCRGCDSATARNPLWRTMSR